MITNKKLILLFCGSLTCSMPLLGMENNVPQAAQQRQLTAHDFEGIDRTCGICQEDFTENDSMTKCPCACKTAYHPDCIRGWIARSPSCPTCRTAVHAVSNGLPVAALAKLSVQDFDGIEPTCNICHENFVQDSDITKCLCPCKFAYHSHCINNWLATNPSCPTCRKETHGVPEGLPFGILEQARPVPQPPVVKAHALTPKDFEGIAPQCTTCAAQFTERDYVTTCPCGCKYAYHYHCLAGQTEDTCPQCHARLERIPDGISFGSLQPKKPALQQPKASNPTASPTPPASQAKPAPTVTPETPLPKLTQAPDTSTKIGLLGESFLAFLYGAFAEHLWSTQAGEQRKRKLGALGLSLVPLHYHLYKKEPQPITKRGSTWLGGTILGFALPWLFKKM
jgi:hypothetical protein